MLSDPLLTRLNYVGCAWKSGLRQLLPDELDPARVFLLAGMPPGRTARMLGGMGLKCLLVDDSARFRNSARALLEREGLEVVLAANSEEAMRHLQEVQPDVILIDINLGDESGIDLSHAIDEGSARNGVRIILISTQSDTDFGDLIDASPALGFLSKSSLSAGAIRELLARAG